METHPHDPEKFDALIIGETMSESPFDLSEYLKGDVFEAKPRPNATESDKPTPARTMRKPRAANSAVSQGRYR